MSKRNVSKKSRVYSATPNQIEQYALPTKRKHLIWFNADKHELDVVKIPLKYLHFNIENGRYADKMIQLKADNPTEVINPNIEK